MTSFIVLKILSDLILPPASLAVAAILFLLLRLLRRRRLGTMLLTLAVAETAILSFPPVSDALMAHLENKARAAAASAPRCCFDAIVVLGGGINPAMPPARTFPDLNDSADRMWLAARLFHQGVAPRIIVSGGGFMAREDGATTEAAAMRLFLIDLGVPSDAIVPEDRSINTIENMRYVRRMVGEGRVALVTSAYHMPRSLLIARREKLAVAAFPTDFRALRATRPFWENWIPSADSLSIACLAVRELLAINLDWRIESEAR
ncbi:MAG TPA: YdcF family protein [Reyranella sp.]|nr:YdcF family protein [Reyranella sp.]